MSEYLILIDKPEGMSSHSAVARARSQLGERKIGHAGTLDPFATGLLVCGYKRSLKLLPYLALTPKVYHATVLLGAQSPSFDPEGAARVVSTVETPTEPDIQIALAKLEAQTHQIPPAYSALHIDGKRAYKLAREGVKVDIPARAIERPIRLALAHVQQVERGEWQGLVEIELECSVGSGYYIRSLARDLGAALGESAICSRLRRVALGAIHVQQAVRPDEIVATSLHRLSASDLSIPSIEVDRGHAADLRHGREIMLPSYEGVSCSSGAMLALWHDGACVAVGEMREEGRIGVRKVVSL